MSGLEDNTVKIRGAVTGICTQTLKGYSSYFWLGNPKDRSHQDYGIGLGNRWITRDSENWLWLPPGSQPDCLAVDGSMIAFGCRLGRVLIMTFPIDKEC